MKKLLVTLNIDDYDEEITDITFPYGNEGSTIARNVKLDYLTLHK